MSYDIQCRDTICAVATPMGLGALAIVRASGPKSYEIFAQIFKKKRGFTKPARALYGDIIDDDSSIIDEVMALYFVGGKSFSGEDSFEIHCHGNHIIVDRILKRLCALGARLAEPGEFSLRAVLNKKIDLAQAESILELIHAQSESAQKVALLGVRGGLREKIAPIHEALINTLAHIEARMDFPDEDLGGYDKSHLLSTLLQCAAQLQELLRHAPHALKLSEGARIVICGKPNAGKSTLLNTLCGEERAIVHETAGTTRDVIEARLLIHDIPITMVDVAGIRDYAEAEHIEKIGMEKALYELKRAHLVIWLADATQKNPFDDAVIEEQVAALEIPVLKVLNKTELLHGEQAHDGLSISAKLGLGIGDLQGLIYGHVVGNKSPTQDMFITKARQRDEVAQALSHLQEAHQALSSGWADEVVTAELRACGFCFDRLFGTTLSEDVLDTIFSQFCIGK